MKREGVLCAALVAACWAGVCRAADVLDLSGTWRLAPVTNLADVCDVQVPGDVHTALRAAGKMPDPYWGCNETNVQQIARADWVFVRTFDVAPSFVARKRVVLEIEDADTFADVYLNGEKVGETSNRFARWTFDAKGALKAGRNELRAVFRSAWCEADRRAAAIGRPFPMSNVPWAKNQAFIRKPACHAGWDWGLAQMTTGFCGPVRLVAHDGLKIDYVYSEPSFNGDLSHCDLTVFADVTDADGRTATVTNRVAIDNPPLWWPNGAGEQRFYTYSVKVGDKTVTRRVGLRKVEILNTPDVDAKGRLGARMAVRVNNRELFMKGANWIPCDAFESRQTPARYRDLLESAAAANMNMIRLWGGGQYEKDAFYDLCDELGLLIWHDHMFSCAVYPATDAFLDEVRGELRHQLRRLRDHASIALWCGDNECVGALGWYDETKKDPAYYKAALMRRHAVQDEMVARHDPTRLFWPSSPCAGPGNFADNWKNDSQGDMHNWQVWHENRPFDAYYAYSPRFCSEFGYQSFPSLEVAETFATREQVLSRAPEFEWHQKNPGGNRRIRETMLRYFRPAKDVASELLLSQFQQGMAIKMAVDGWRAQRPRCMGTLFWQLNDNWPVASWSSIEYGGKWKPLQHMARRFYAPVAVVAQPAIAEGKADVTRGQAVALNDTAETVRGELAVEYWTYDGRVVQSETRPVALPPDSATAVAAFAKPAGSEATFLVLTLTTPRSTYQNDWHFGFYKDMPLAAATVTAKTRETADGRTEATLSTDRPAFFVWANAAGVRGEFDDNCFTLLPGRPKTLTFSGGAIPAEALTVSHLASLADDSAATSTAAYQAIEAAVAASDADLARRQAALTDVGSLDAYRAVVKNVNGTNVWTAALQAAVRDHAVVRIPASDATYWIDATVVIPSNRRIEASGARISLLPGTQVLMLRNEHAPDGTLAPIRGVARDANIAVVGGRWEDWTRERKGYGVTGRYDLGPRRAGRHFGVSALFYFGNCDAVTIRDATFAYTSGFAVQTGDGRGRHFENIRFESCFADGLHLNGNLVDVHVKNVRGKVGDDLVALNAYDWLNSSVNFGPQKNVLCEDLELVLENGEGYPAIRILPAKYRYADGTVVDCAVSDVIFRRVKGIQAFKMYLQTPCYRIGEKPEWSEVGSGGNLFFEDIAIDLRAPIDNMGQYRDADPVRGHFGAFEFGANLSSVHLKNIDITFHLEDYPLSHLAVVGPKSCCLPGANGEPGTEYFDPYVSCRVGTVTVDGLKVHGRTPAELVRATAFDDVNRDGRSSGRGVIGRCQFR